METLGLDFCEGDGLALQMLLTSVIREGVVVIEIGSWAGSSTVYLAKTALAFHGSVFAVDHWRGSPRTESEETAKREDVFSIFKQNIIEQGVWDIVHPLVMDSITASKIFRDNIADLIFIDADHRYECVKQDILSWLPKVRQGGILCGHDIFRYYSSFPEQIKQMIDNSPDKDTIYPIPHVCIHPGVTKALYEIFSDQYTIIENTSIWCVQVGVNVGAR